MAGSIGLLLLLLLLLPSFACMIGSLSGHCCCWLGLALLLLSLFPCCCASCLWQSTDDEDDGGGGDGEKVRLMGLAGEATSPASGGGFSANGKFSYGYASSLGKRSSMEDFYDTRIDGVDGETVGLFGVFDGHGGARAAEFVKQNLFTNLIKHPKFFTDTKSAIAETYTNTDSEFLKAEASQNRDAGSTASTAILVGDRLLVANVGDSRAVICRGGDAIAVSRDHKPDQSDERQRIEDAGGFVMWAGTWRVGGVLAVSRAFGDKLLKQYVVADPEIKEEVVDSSLEFLILASDGLWDVVTNEEAVAMVKPILDSEQAAKRLLQEASQRGSADNITCLVVRFLEQDNQHIRPTNDQAS
uniref:protein-serine/threonine phosphatase n=1 Tax=Leersia perrieri TaxID=77586 RepID=A0A0D9WTN9_9ORYZ